MRRLSSIAALACLMAAPLAFAVPALAQAAPKPPAAKPEAAKPEAAKPQGASFQSFIQSLWPLAQSRGISRQTFDTAFAGLTPDPSIITLTKKQSEFVAPIWGYMASAVNGNRIGRGQEMAQTYGGVLAQVERTYGVPKEVVLGVWGMETGYGGFKGDKDVIRSLATLAHLRYRGEFFRDELMIALEMLEKGLAERDEMRGSWAGAMGHTQFMPSSYMKHAVAYAGAGTHADIWDKPADALASTANYLKSFGWEPGLPWGIEVDLPSGYDYKVQRGSFASFAAARVARSDGRAMPSTGEARLFFPAGHKGPVFLLTSNFDVIKKYNSSDAYALAVGHLGDRIMGRAGIQAGWPTDAPRLNKNQIQEVQRRLKALGLYTADADGRIGTGTRDAVRQYQLRAGIIADGYPTPALLARLKGSS